MCNFHLPMGTRSLHTKPCRRSAEQANQHRLVYKHTSPTELLAPPPRPLTYRCTTCMVWGTVLWDCTPMLTDYWPDAWFEERPAIDKPTTKASRQAAGESRLTHIAAKTHGATAHKQQPVSRDSPAAIASGRRGRCSAAGTAAPWQFRRTCPRSSASPGIGWASDRQSSRLARASGSRSISKFRATQAPTESA